MKKKVFLSLVLILVGLATGGGCNIFSDVADKTSDAVLLDDIRNHIDRGHWNDAILKSALLSAATLAKRETKLLIASAYAGRGGLDMLRIIKNLNDNSATGGTNASLFITLMKGFRASDLNDFYDQVHAETLLREINTSAVGRTVDENLFMVFVSMAKLGTLFSARADADNDLTVDTTFDNCTSITALEAGHIITGLSNLFESLQAAGSTIANSSTTDLATACTQFGANFCATTDITQVNAVFVSVARTLAGENNMNIGLKVHPGAARDHEFIDPCPACAGATVVPLPTSFCP